jgi:hypothetical protein
MLKFKFSLSRHFEYANNQITYHFWLCGVEDRYIVEESFFDKYFAEKLEVPTII